MNSRLYKYVENNMRGNNGEKWANDELIQRTIDCYANSEHYQSWRKQLTFYPTLIQSVLSWLNTATSEQLELEFNSHEIIELMLSGEQENEHT